jgi:hypothetical protein
MKLNVSNFISFIFLARVKKCPKLRDVVNGQPLTYVDSCVEVDAVVVAVEGVLRVRRAVVRDDRTNLIF